MNNDEKILSMLENMQADMSGLKADVAQLKEGQAKLETSVAKLEAGQAKLESELGEVKETVTRVQNTVTRMEHEHGQRFDALFDGHDVLLRRTLGMDSKLAQLVDEKLERMFAPARAT